MVGWIGKKLRAGRYSMNLQLLEADLKGTPTTHRAAVLVAAAGMIQKLQTDDFVQGSMLDRTITEPFSAAPEVAEQFYNSLEDVLTFTESERSQVVRRTAEKLGSAAAKDMDGRLKLQQQGMRFLLVALARQVDEDFKPKARRLREALFEVHTEIESAVAVLEREETLVQSVTPNARGHDYEAVKTKASLLSFSLLSW